MTSVSDIAKACDGAACVVSALAGLRDVILDTQSILLEAALAARIPRFIPSDFSMDFPTQPDGENRNLDLRREFHQRLDAAPIASTSIFNGPFGEVLTMYNHVPLFDFNKKMVGYCGEPDWRIGFSTMNTLRSTRPRLRLTKAPPAPCELPASA
jgi:hypothetical protein